MTQPRAEMLDLYRAGLKSAADLMKTSFESVERLQNQQLVAIHTALVEGGKSVAELSSARTLDERALSLWSDWLDDAGERGGRA